MGYFGFFRSAVLRPSVRAARKIPPLKGKDWVELVPFLRPSERTARKIPPLLLYSYYENIIILFPDCFDIVGFLQ